MYTIFIQYNPARVSIKPSIFIVKNKQIPFLIVCLVIVIDAHKMSQRRKDISD